MRPGGYTGNVLRVDLTKGETRIESLDDVMIKRWVGGVGFGAHYLWEEVPASVNWSDPDNIMVWASGPLAGSGMYGAGTINITAKGPMTNLAGSSQANGFFGAYLKFSGFDAMVIQGRAPKLVYLWIRDGIAEIRDASRFRGMDIFNLESSLREELNMKPRQTSIYGTGPAGENLVRYASIGGDGGHFAAHNGLGAVMGSKNLKAVVTHLHKPRFEIADVQKLKTKCEALFNFAKGFGHVYKWGTGGGVSALHETGGLPVKNYTTNIYPAHEKMSGQYMRTHYKLKSKPCYKCKFAHVKEVTVTEGPFKGFVGEEPEYEQLAAWGPQIGNTELGAVVMLAREVDRLGMDCNEASWTIGWLMECYEKGIITKNDVDGLDMSWGNIDSVKIMLGKIAHCEGIGKFLADGVMRASQKIGEAASDLAIFTFKGGSPRTHDHRGGKWHELFDTCVTNTSTLESTWVGVHPQLVDQPAITDMFSHEEVAAVNAKFNGIRQFDDCLGTCRLVAPHPKLQLDCVNAVTGWRLSLEDAFKIGLRVVNQFRVFNIRHGLKKEMERPSKKYGSKPIDGPACGKGILEKWEKMLEIYYTAMGWDSETGKPLPQTLERLGLQNLIGNC
jgi:aldehyde:ferredoxin oxidoreductase